VAGKISENKRREGKAKNGKQRKNLKYEMKEKNTDEDIRHEWDCANTRSHGGRRSKKVRTSWTRRAVFRRPGKKGGGAKKLQNI